MRAPENWRICISIIPISSPNPMLNHLLQSSHQDDSSKWSNIGFYEEIKQVELTEVKFTHIIWSSENWQNKNWVTVRDKCPQINVQFKWHTF